MSCLILLNGVTGSFTPSVITESATLESVTELYFGPNFMDFSYQEDKDAAKRTVKFGKTFWSEEIASQDQKNCDYKINEIVGGRSIAVGGIRYLVYYKIKSEKNGCSILHCQVDSWEQPWMDLQKTLDSKCFPSSDEIEEPYQDLISRTDSIMVQTSDPINSPIEAGVGSSGSSDSSNLNNVTNSTVKPTLIGSFLIFFSSVFLIFNIGIRVEISAPLLN